MKAFARRGKANSKKFAAWLKKVANQAIIWDSALKAYEKADPEKQKAIMDTAIRVGLLAAINRDKTKQVKSYLRTAIDQTSSDQNQGQTVAERLRELKNLHENQLITTPEYDAKKTEIMSQV